MTMVVEGVEDAAAVEALRDRGCEYAQGYFIARPMTGDDIIGWLRSRRLSGLRALRS